MGAETVVIVDDNGESANANAAAEANANAAEAHAERAETVTDNAENAAETAEEAASSAENAAETANNAAETSITGAVIAQDAVQQAETLLDRFVGAVDTLKELLQSPVPGSGNASAESSGETGSGSSDVAPVEIVEDSEPETTHWFFRPLGRKK